MKTNKERAKIIMQRYNTADKMQNETALNVSNEKKTKKKFVWTKKAIVSVCTACVMILTLGLGLGLGIGLKKDDILKPIESLSLNNKYIANFSEYNSLGCAELNDVSNVSVASVSIGASRKKEHHRKLVGVKDDGTIEEVKVVENQDGENEPEEIKWELSGVLVLKNYTIAQYMK